MNKEIKYSQSVNIYASKETVWNNLLSKEFYELSWDATLTSTWQPGSPIQFKGVWEGIEYTDKGMVQEIEENIFLESRGSPRGILQHIFQDHGNRFV